MFFPHQKLTWIMPRYLLGEYGPLSWHLISAELQVNKIIIQPNIWFYGASIFLNF